MWEVARHRSLPLHELTAYEAPRWWFDSRKKSVMSYLLTQQIRFSVRAESGFALLVRTRRTMLRP